MFKKGHMPHNKGDDRVETHYRDKPKTVYTKLTDRGKVVRISRNEAMRLTGRKMSERPIDSWQGSNPFKLNIKMSDLAVSKNTVRNSTVELF